MYRYRTVYTVRTVSVCLYDKTYTRYVVLLYLKPDWWLHVIQIFSYNIIIYPYWKLCCTFGFFWPNFELWADQYLFRVRFVAALPVAISIRMSFSVGPRRKCVCNLKPDWWLQKMWSVTGLEDPSSVKIPMTHILRAGAYINIQSLRWYKQYLFWRIKIERPASNFKLIK